MNAQALHIAQAMHDNDLPVEIDDSAGQRWLDTSAEQLVGGVDVRICRWGKPTIVISYDSLVQAVDEHIMTRIADNQIDTFALGALVLQAGKRGDVSELLVELLGPSDHCDGMRYEIADRLLRPHLAAALVEIAEDNTP